MAKEKEGYDLVSYILGIVSIVLAFFQPGAGIVLGIVGIFQSRREKTAFAKKGKKLSIIGLVLSVVLLVVAILVAYYATSSLGSQFPTY